MKISVNYRYLYVLTQIVTLLFLNLTCTNDDDLLSLDETNSLQSSMSGAIVDKSGKGLSGVSVTAYPGGTTTMSNNDGTFALTGLRAGKSTFVFRYADFTDTTIDTISLGLLESKKLKEPLRMRYRYGWIRGNVTAGLTSVIDAGVQVENQIASTRTLRTGSFTLSKVLPGRCKVYGSLRGVGYGLVEHEIKADDTSTITIAITNAGGTVQGKVVDAANNPVAGATVSVMNNVIVSTTDASGSYILTEVPGNGRLTLTVSKGSDTMLVSGVQVADSQSVTIQNVKLLSIVQQGQLRILPAAVRTVAGKPTSILVSSAGSVGSSGIAWFDWDEDGNGTFDRRTPVPVDTGLVFTEGTHYVKVRAVGIDTTVKSETITIEVTSISSVATKKYQLLVDFDPLRGTVSPSNGSFVADSKVVFSVATKNDYVFDHWGGTDSALMRGDTLYMPKRHVAIQALFKLHPYVIDLKNYSDTITWDTISGFSYHLQASTTELFDSMHLDTIIFGNKLVMEKQSSHAIFVRAAKLDTNGLSGPWSKVISLYNYVLLDDFEGSIPAITKNIPQLDVVFQYIHDSVSTITQTDYISSIETDNVMGKHVHFTVNFSDRMQYPMGECCFTFGKVAASDIRYSPTCFVYSKVIDLSGLDSIVFWAKGNGVIDISFTSYLVDVQMKDWGNPEASVQLTNEWTKYSIPVSILRPRPYSKATMDSLVWDDFKNRIGSIDFHAIKNATSYLPDGKYLNFVNSTLTSMDVYLDDIRLYGITAKDLEQGWVNVSDLLAGDVKKPDVDTIPPRIIILGKQYDTVLVNTTWNYLDSVRVVDALDPKPTYTKEPASISTTTENSFKITYIAKDSSGNIDTAYRYLVVMKPTALQEKYNVFAAPKLPDLGNGSFTSFTTEGTPPDLKNLKSLSFLWDGERLSFFSFSYNADPYVKSFTETHTLSSPKPQITLSGSGISGLDGKYYVVLNDKNLVWISEDGSFAITWIP